MAVASSSACGLRAHVPLGVDPEEWGLDSEYPPPGVHTCLGGGACPAAPRVLPPVQLLGCGCSGDRGHRLVCVDSPQVQLGPGPVGRSLTELPADPAGAGSRRWWGPCPGAQGFLATGGSARPPGAGTPSSLCGSGAGFGARCFIEADANSS